MKKAKKDKQKMLGLAVLVFFLFFGLVLLLGGWFRGGVGSQLKTDATSNQMSLQPSCGLVLTPTVSKVGSAATVRWTVVGAQNVQSAKLSCDLLGLVDTDVTNEVKQKPSGTKVLPAFGAAGTETCKMYLNSSTVPCTSNSITVAAAPAASCTMKFIPASVPTTVGYSSLSWSILKANQNDKAKIVCEKLYKNGFEINPYNQPVGLLVMGSYGAAGTEKCKMFLNDSTTALCEASLTITGGSTPAGDCSLSFNPSTINKGQSSTLNWSAKGGSNVQKAFINCESGQSRDVTSLAVSAGAGVFPTSKYGSAGTDKCTITVDYTAASGIDQCVAEGGLTIR